MLAASFCKLLHGVSKRHAHGAASQVPLHLHNALDMLKHAPVDLIQVRWPSLTWLRELPHIPTSSSTLCLLRQVPGAGRGLAAAQPLAQGTAVHTEKPMLCYPNTKHIGKVMTSSSTQPASHTE